MVPVRPPRPAPAPLLADGRVGQGARLDRIYSNHPPGDQLLYDYYAFCNRISAELSDHSPVYGGKRALECTGSAARVPAWFARLPIFGPMVADALHGTTGDPAVPDAFRDLDRFKRAVRAARRRYRREGHRRPDATPRQRLAILYEFLAAHKKAMHMVMRVHLDHYDWLRPYASEINGAVRISDMGGILDLLRDQEIQDVEAEQNATEAASATAPADVTSNARRRVAFRLSRLVPGETVSIGAIELSDGSIATEDDAMAAALTEHWGAVFQDKPVDSEALGRWLDPEGDGNLPDWLPPFPNFEDALTIDHVRLAIKHAKESAPGPDGIPYSAYRDSDFAAEALFTAAKEILHNQAAWMPAAFNEAFLVCLGKKPSRADAIHGLVFRAAATRPLSISNTDNRIIAGAIRILVEAKVAEWVSEAQRGFLRGRSMVLNIVEVDHAMRTLAFHFHHPAAVFFDFSAAFPSISWEYMWHILKRISAPEFLRTALRNLYRNNSQILRLRSASGKHAFVAKAGVKQGCPLSPLIFAVCVDPLLRRLGNALPGALIRAFADDIALVARTLPMVRQALKIFDHFGRISNLVLNLGKTILVPLWTADVEDARGFLQSACLRRLLALTLATAAKYLGVQLGPTAFDVFWTEVENKFEARISRWAQPRLGFHLLVQAYNTMVASVTSFLLQFAPPSPRIQALERVAARRSCPGPGTWLSADEPYHLKEWYGFKGSLRNLTRTSIAARARISLNEHFDFAKHAAALKDRVLTSPGRLHTFKDWALRGIIFNIADNHTTLLGYGLRIQDIPMKIRDTMRNPEEHSLDSSLIRRRIQKWTYSYIMDKDVDWGEQRIRHHLDRWRARLPGPPRLAARARAGQANLRKLAKLVPPRVHAVVFRTLFNGWYTDRRCAQNRESPCRLGCGHEHGRDSLEHYVCCKRLHDFARNYLRIPASVLGDVDFWLVTTHFEEETTLVRLALLQYAAYRLRNFHAHSASLLSAPSAFSFLKRAVTQGASGHRRCRAALRALGALQRAGPAASRA